MYACINEHRVSKENEEEIPLLTRHNNSEGKIYTHFTLLSFNEK